MFLYAEDSAIIASNKNEIELRAILQEEFGDWLLDNKLSLHVAKTEFIVFGSKPRLHKKELSSISLGGQLFPAKPSVTYLGCCLDSNLDGGSMAFKVMSKVNGRSRFLARKAPLEGRSFACDPAACVSIFKCLELLKRTLFKT